MPAARRLLQPALFFGFLFAVGLTVLSSLPSNVLLPEPGLYVAFCVLPCRPLASKLLLWLGALASALTVVAIQMRALVAHALSVGESGLGGMLSNFYVTADQAFSSAFLVGAFGALLLAITSSRWAPAR
jgi:hypothetical protein